MNLKKITSVFILSSMAMTSVVSAAAFDDIENHWAKDIINNLAAKGIVHGISDTEFNPDGIVTRAEFIKMAMDTVKIEEVPFRSGECLDVTASDWYGNYIQSALDKGLIPEEMIGGFASKISDGNANSVYSGYFNADKPIKREEMAYIAQSVYQYTRDEDTADDMQYPQDLQFIDVASISKWAFRGVQYAYSNKLVLGMDDDTFKPQDTATRAQSASIINNLLDKTE